MLKIRNWLKSLASDKAKQKKLLIIGGPIVCAAICIILVLVLQNPTPEVNSGVSLNDPQGASEEIKKEEPKEEAFENAILSGEFDETILGETSDAGVEYVKETLFIGDSNTAGMINNSSTTNISMNNGIGIVSMGVSHVTSLRCVKFQGMGAIAVPEAVKILQPRRIVITYGTNDYYMKPEEFAKNYRTAIEAIEEAYPYSDIIIGSIFPITANCSYYTVSMPIVEKFNVELIKLAKEKGLHLLNWSEALKDPVSGYCKPEYMAGDGVHLNKKGMEQISNYFRTHKLESEDKRPKPLDPIPVRQPTPEGLLGSGPQTPAKPEPEPEPEPVVEAVVVTVSFGAGEGGSVSGGGTFSVAPGSTLSATAVPYEGYAFAGWAGGGGGETITFTVPADAAPGSAYSFTATFALVAPPVEQPPVEQPPIEEPPPVEEQPPPEPTPPEPVPPAEPPVGP